MDKILKTLGISEEFTKAGKKQKIFNKVKNNIPLREDYNFMADLLELPKTKNDYRYLLAVVDLATDEFDIEPLKTKTPEAVKVALLSMFKRNHIKKPYASIRTDGGTEFKGVFHKYLHDNSILQRVALPHRHKQLSNVESLNKALGRVFNGYMNMHEEKTGKPYKNWDDIIHIVRTKLNEYRKITIPKNTPLEFTFNPTKKQKFNIGDVVHFKLDYPEDALGNKQPTENFRVGDYRFSHISRQIKKVIFMNDEPYYRYILEHMPNVSYSENELKLSKNKGSNYKVKSIIGKKKIKNVVHYLVWWKGYLKKDATYEPENNLIEDGLQQMIDDYNSNI